MHVLSESRNWHGCHIIELHISAFYQLNWTLRYFCTNPLWRWPFKIESSPPFILEIWWKPYQFRIVLRKYKQIWVQYTFGALRGVLTCIFQKAGGSLVNQIEHNDESQQTHTSLYYHIMTKNVCVHLSSEIKGGQTVNIDAPLT